MIVAKIMDTPTGAFTRSRIVPKNLNRVMRIPGIPKGTRR